jgi:hypothetical protein
VVYGSALYSAVYTVKGGILYMKGHKVYNRGSLLTRLVELRMIFFIIAGPMIFSLNAVASSRLHGVECLIV